MADDYIDLGQGKEGKYTMTVLIISTSCIGITLLASIVLIPFTFSLDSEEQNAANTWMLISPLTKQKVLKNINEFSNSLVQEKIKYPKKRIKEA